MAVKYIVCDSFSKGIQSAYSATYTLPLTYYYASIYITLPHQDCKWQNIVKPILSYQSVVCKFMRANGW